MVVVHFLLFSEQLHILWELSLLAMASGHSTLMLAVQTSSRASSAPTGYAAAIKVAFIAMTGFRASSTSACIAMLARLISHALCHKRYKLSPTLYQTRYSAPPPVRQNPAKPLVSLPRKAVARPLLYAYSRRTCALPYKHKSQGELHHALRSPRY